MIKSFFSYYEIIFSPHYTFLNSVHKLLLVLNEAPLPIREDFQFCLMSFCISTPRSMLLWMLFSECITGCWLLSFWKGSCYSFLSPPPLMKTVDRYGKSLGHCSVRWVLKKQIMPIYEKAKHGKHYQGCCLMKIPKNLSSSQISNLGAKATVLGAQKYLQNIAIGKCKTPGAHQMKPPSVLISWVNPFPSRFVDRNIFFCNALESHECACCLLSFRCFHWLSSSSARNLPKESFYL